MESYPEFRQLEPPIALVGEVVPGFGRGSKELGIPTANLDPATLGPAMDGVVPGIYCGWASVEGSPPYKAVASIGFNPYYKGTTMTVEPHICHLFDEPFYGKELRLVLGAYMRPELNFTSFEALVAAIHGDIDAGKAALDTPGLASLAAHPLFQ